QRGMTGFRHDMPFGASLQPDRTTRFRLWAPGAERISIITEQQAALVMDPQADGWFELTTDRVGGQYSYQLPNGMRVPDPASRQQAEDVHGPSVVVDPLAYAWRHADWRGRPWQEVVLYELHTGTFSNSGDFDGLQRRLDWLAGLGVTAIELMPIADFSG